MFAVQPRLYSSKNLMRKSLCILSLNGFCKKCSQNVNAAEKDVSEEVSNKLFGERVREREISLLGPIDPRLPFPGNVGCSPSGPRQTAKRLMPITQLEVSVELDIERQARVLDMLLSFENFDYDLVDFANFEMIVTHCPQLIRYDFQQLFPERVFDNRVTLVMFRKDLRVENNKSEIFQQFVNVSQEICKRLVETGFWAHFVNPWSINDDFTYANSFEASQRFRRKNISLKSLKKCVLITYQHLEKDFFVGSLFTNAPVNSPELKAILKELKS